MRGLTISFQPLCEAELFDRTSASSPPYASSVGRRKTLIAVVASAWAETCAEARDGRKAQRKTPGQTDMRVERIQSTAARQLTPRACPAAIVSKDSFWNHQGGTTVRVVPPTVSRVCRSCCGAMQPCGSTLTPRLCHKGVARGPTPTPGEHRALIPSPPTVPNLAEM